MRSAKPIAVVKKASVLLKKDLKYILFNKPYDVLSQFTPDHIGQRTLAAFDLPEGVYPAGRLDKDSEGLLLLTNDGPLIKMLLDPAQGHERTYLVQVEGVPDDAAFEKLRSGISISGYVTKPATAELLLHLPEVPERVPPIRIRKSIPDSWIKLTLIEGKNRQVRHMTAAIGFPTLRLIRISIGELTIEGLAEGEWKWIEREQILKSAGRG
jgi:23S rRNA pseudouridine2457 synthase